MPTRFSETQVDVPTRALQAYLILIGVASNRQTITYEGIARKYGYKSPETTGKLPVGQTLGPLVQWCRDRELPLLNCLVVSSVHGEPGTELHGTDLPAERERVYAEDWYDLLPPTIKELRAAWDDLRG